MNSVSNENTLVAQRIFYEKLDNWIGAHHDMTPLRLSVAPAGIFSKLR